MVDISIIGVIIYNKQYGMVAAAAGGEYTTIIDKTSSHHD